VRAAARARRPRRASGRVRVLFGRPEHARHVPRIRALMQGAAREGAAVAMRTAAYLRALLEESKAVVALRGDRLVGFAAFQVWEGGRFVSHFGMVVDPAMRGHGVARAMKEKLFALSRRRHPRASVVSLTRSPAVLAMNKGLGFREVTHLDLPTDPAFWEACKTCPHYEAVERTSLVRCCCTSTRFDPPARPPRRARPR